MLSHYINHVPNTNTPYTHFNRIAITTIGRILKIEHTPPCLDSVSTFYMIFKSKKYKPRKLSSDVSNLL